MLPISSGNQVVDFCAYIILFFYLVDKVTGTVDNIVMNICKTIALKYKEKDSTKESD